MPGLWTSSVRFSAPPGEQFLSDFQDGDAGPASPRAADPRDLAAQRPIHAWIDVSALRRNARRAIEAAGGRQVIGVVKADGYGHGAETVARALLAEGVGRLAVVSIAEGAALRRAGIVVPILLLGGLDEAAGAALAVKWGLTPVLQDTRGMELAQSFGRPEAPLAVEVEVDSGMARMGTSPDRAPGLIARVQDAPQLALAGVFTHLARADEADAAPSRAQCQALAALLPELEVEGERLPVVHVSNSASLLRLEEIEGGVIETDAVRPGLMLYGVTPFADRAAETLGLEPAMTLAARVIALRRVPAGASVGYGAEWSAPRETTIATLPLGYADGIPRSVLGRGRVHLAGALRPIVGRVSMDSVCVDVGDADVAIGDEATIFGVTPEGVKVPVEDFAASAGTIAYEILVGVGARVPRLVREGPRTLR
jgi:alanine racemase